MCSLLSHLRLSIPTIITDPLSLQVLAQKHHVLFPTKVANFVSHLDIGAMSFHRDMLQAPVRHGLQTSLSHKFQLSEVFQSSTLQRVVQARS